LGGRRERSHSKEERGKAAAALFIIGAGAHKREKRKCISEGEAGLSRDPRGKKGKKSNFRPKSPAARRAKKADFREWEAVECGARAHGERTKQKALGSEGKSGARNGRKSNENTEKNPQGVECKM